MSILNAYTPQGAATFTHRLSEAIPLMKKLSLQSLQHQIALALGARSLEAYQAEIDKMADAKPFGLFAREPYVLASGKIKTRGDISPVDYSYLHKNNSCGEFLKDAHSGLMLFSDASIRYYFLPDETMTHPQDALKPEVNSLLTLTCGYEENSLTACYYEVFPLRDAFPVFYAFLNAETQSEISDLLSGQPDSSLDIDGLTRPCWCDAVERDETCLGYAEWLLHELECCRDDFHRSIASIDLYSTAGFSRFSYTLLELIRDEKELDEQLRTQEAMSVEMLEKLIGFALDGHCPVPVKSRTRKMRFSWLGENKEYIRFSNAENLKQVPFSPLRYRPQVGSVSLGD